MKRAIIYVAGAVAGVVLFAASSMLRFVVQAARITDVWSVGFPFRFYETWGPCPAPGTCQASYPVLFTIDLLLWLALGLALAVAISGVLRRRSDR